MNTVTTYGADIENITASLKDGVLVITIPRREVAKKDVKRIYIY